MDGAKFHGVDLDWMKAQWRDCKNRDDQLAIFRDMTGAKPEEILAILGEEPALTENQKTGFPSQRRPWTEKEDGIIREMKASGCKERDIATVLGRSITSVGVRWSKLKKERPAVPAPTADQKPAQHYRSLDEARSELSTMLEEEAFICEKLAAVRAKIEDYRIQLAEILLMAGDRPNA